MITADLANVFIGATFGALEEKVPALKLLSISELSVVEGGGTYGSIVLSAVFLRGLDGKLTITLEWETALHIVRELTKTKIDTYSSQAEEALAGLLNDILERIRHVCNDHHVRLEILTLPILIDTNVLFGITRKAKTLRVSVHTCWEPIHLYLAFENELK